MDCSTVTSSGRIISKKDCHSPCHWQRYYAMCTIQHQNSEQQVMNNDDHHHCHANSHLPINELSLNQMFSSVNCFQDALSSFHSLIYFIHHHHHHHQHHQHHHHCPSKSGRRGMFTSSNIVSLLRTLFIMTVILCPQVTSLYTHTLPSKTNVINHNQLLKLSPSSVLVLHANRSSNSNNNNIPKESQSAVKSMLLEDLSRYKKDIIELSKIRFDNHGDDNGNYYYNQKKKIIQMMDILHAASHEYTPINKKLHIEASQIIDSTLRHCTNEALEITYYRQGRNKKNYNNYSISWDTVQFGLDLMDVQLRHGTMTDGKRRKILHPPYDTIPQTVCLQALKALNILLLKKGKDVAVTNSYNDITANTLSTANSPIDHIDPQIQHSNAAFRILQRMCTGIGIRTQNSSLSSSRQKPGRVQINLDERDFNMVLNGFVNTNQMNQAHRVIALQVRTEHAPPLSPITYSILIKGYGQLNDLVNVELCMKQCYGHGIRPDIVMFNSLIDAYINCDRIDLAHDIFHFLTSKRGNGRNREMNYSRKYFGSDEQLYLLYGPLNTDIDEEDTMTIPTANVRTYNTMLKGYVKDENIKRAMDLSREMQNLNLWDDITTNTLVSVSVRSNEFELAETLLKNHTKITPRDAMQNSNAKKEREAYRRSKKQHPNVEAYTELLNGYAKSKNLNKALSTLKLMRERGVHPNEFTYTCMIVALTKAHKIDQAKRMIDFMENIDGIRPGVVTYNAFLTGMLERQINDREKENDADDDIAFNSRVNEAGQILQSMMKSAHTRPNTVTAKTMIIALGNCKPSRVQEAKTLVSILEKERFGLISSKDPIIATALIRAYSNSLDYDGVESTYKSIHNPDTILLNAYIEGCCRCGKVKRALDIMADNNDAFRGDDKFTFPDVASYTILISAVLQIGTKSASGRALLLYNEMKRLWGILPDFALVDVILAAMVSGGNSIGINDDDVRFTMNVLSDAKNLNWSRGELKKREMAVKGIFMGRISEAWKEDETRYGLGTEKTIDPLFKKKNWNQIDSGFRLWGGGNFDGSEKKNAPVDKWLESKNWNDIDSSFRIL